MTGELTYAAETMAAEVVPVPFLIDTLKRLEIAVSRTKQTTEAVSNRYKMRGSVDSISGAELAAVELAEAGPIGL